MNNTHKPIPLLVSEVDHYLIPGPDENGAYDNTFQKAGYRQQQSDPEGFLLLAKEQHRNLCAIFEKVSGVAPIRMPAKRGLGDAVFTSDPFITITVPDGNSAKRLILPSKFTNIHRHDEVPYATKFLHKTLKKNPQLSLPQQFAKAANDNASIPGKIINFLAWKLWKNKTKVIQPRFNIEGSGDNTYDTYRGCYWSGHVAPDQKGTSAAGRSHKEAHTFLQAATSIPVHSIELVKPFFHIDTIMCPLPCGRIMVYPDGMTPESFAYFKKAAFENYGLDPDEYMIEVSKEDAYAYGCNARVMNDQDSNKHIIMPNCSEQLQQRLTDANYIVHTVELSCFLASGGGVKCLSHNIGLEHKEGGTSAIITDMPIHEPLAA